MRDFAIVYSARRRVTVQANIDLCPTCDGADKLDPLAYDAGIASCPGGRGHAFSCAMCAAGESCGDACSSCGVPCDFPCECP